MIWRCCWTSFALARLVRARFKSHVTTSRGTTGEAIAFHARNGPRSKVNHCCLVLYGSILYLPAAVGPLDVLLVEGWCMGFQAIDDATVSECGSKASHDVTMLELMTLTYHGALSDNLRPINNALRAFDQLYEQLDALIVIQIAVLDWVYTYAPPIAAFHFAVTNSTHHATLVSAQVAGRARAAPASSQQAGSERERGARLRGPLHAGLQGLSPRALRRPPTGYRAAPCAPFAADSAPCR